MTDLLDVILRVLGAGLLGCFLVAPVVRVLRARDRSAKHQDAQRLGPEGVEPGHEVTRPRTTAAQPGEKP